MHRFFLESEQVSDKLELTGREAKHAAQVLRLRVGDLCSVLNGAGGEFSCEVAQLSKHRVDLRVLEQKRHDPPACRITLFQALPKGKLIETIIQKATELGVARVVPLITERVVPHLDKEAAATKAERWRQTAIEAIKQCGAPWLPTVAVPLPFNAALAELKSSEVGLIASLQPDRRHVREVVVEFMTRHGRKPTSASMWVGPEGDFTAAELAALLHSGAHAITLGRNVLRADTAAVAGLATLLSELDAPES